VKKVSNNRSQNRKSIHAGQQREMHKIDEALYFVIEEKTIK
jgi:hypothetical protein